jgi:hypothetical protein
MAAGFVIGGSILLVLTVFDTLTGLRSVEMRDELTETLSSPTFRDLGITVGEALTGMRVGLMVAGACAAATAVLGVYALQRSRPARLALSVLAVPILLTAPLTGGLMGALVAAAILMLWSGPARDWFAGRAVRQPEPPATPRTPGSDPWEQTMPGARGRPPGNGSQDGSRTDPPQPAPQDSATGPDTPPASSLSASGFSTAPGATTGFGERPAPAGDTLTREWLPPSYEQVTRGQVPVTVKLACFLTWAFAGVVALLYAVMLVVLVVADQRVVDYVLDSPEWQRANLEQDIVLPVLWFGCLLFLGWSVAACVLAWFTWRRHNWARWMLTVSAVVTTIAATFAFPVGVLHQLAAILTVAGLFSAAARAWFDPRSGAHGPPPGSPSGRDFGAHAAPAPDSQLPGPPPGSYPPPPTGQEQPPPTGGKPPVW